MTYAACCKNCGFIETNAYYPPTSEQRGQPMRVDGKAVALTPQGHIPVWCPRCGGSWRVPATAEDLAKFEAAAHRSARAAELCRGLSIDGLLKVPEEVRASPEVKNALSNLFAPLEGETLKLAQSLVLKVARSGISAAADEWIELYDRAVTKALKDAKGVKAVA